MSPTEIVAAPQGELLVQPGRALRFAWGLASAYHAWLDAKAPLALPELPPDVADLVDIPYAVSELGRDGRYDRNGLDNDGHRSCEGRDHWRPDVRIGPATLVWYPLELDASRFAGTGREAGRRQIEIEARPRDDRWIVRWDTGGRPSRFVARCALAVLGTTDLRHVSGLLSRRPCEPGSWWALPAEGGP